MLPVLPGNFIHIHWSFMFYLIYMYLLYHIYVCTVYVCKQMHPFSSTIHRSNDCSIKNALELHTGVTAQDSQKTQIWNSLSEFSISKAALNVGESFPLNHGDDGNRGYFKIIIAMPRNLSLLVIARQSIFQFLQCKIPGCLIDWNVTGIRSIFVQFSKLTKLLAFVRL